METAVLDRSNSKLSDFAYLEAYSEVELTKIVRGIGAGQDMIHLAGSDF